MTAGLTFEELIVVHQGMNVTKGCLFVFSVRFHDKLSIDDVYEPLNVMTGGEGVSRREIRINVLRLPQWGKEINSMPFLCPVLCQALNA